MPRASLVARLSLIVPALLAALAAPARATTVTRAATASASASVQTSGDGTTTYTFTLSNTDTAAIWRWGIWMPGSLDAPSPQNSVAGWTSGTNIASAGPGGATMLEWTFAAGGQTASSTIGVGQTDTFTITATGGRYSGPFDFFYDTVNYYDPSGATFLAGGPDLLVAPDLPEPGSLALLAAGALAVAAARRRSRAG